MNVLGLDLSITATGICGADAMCETVGGVASSGDYRLVKIRNAVRHYLKAGRWDLAVIEDVPRYDHGTFVLAEVRGAVKVELVAAGIPYAFVSPPTLKVYATGNSKADKAAMILAVQQHSGFRPGDDNQADAWWLRQMGADALGASTLGLPLSQRRAMQKIDWPANVVRYRRGMATDTGGAGRLNTCRHKVTVMQNGDHWLHPMTFDVCDKPPRAEHPTLL